MGYQTISEQIFFLRRDGSTNLQAQLREMIVSAVFANQLMPGSRLPSTRKLAKYLNISRLTVTLAYQELVAQGLLESVARSSYRVADRPGELPYLERASQKSKGQIDWSKRLSGAARIHNPVQKPMDWRRYPYPFVYGQMDMSLFGLQAWRDCARRALGKQDFSETASDVAASDDAMLVNYICTRTLPMRGINASPSEVLVTLGAQNAIWIIIQMLLAERGHAVHENPGHPDLTAALQLSKAKVTPVSVDHQGLPPKALPDQTDVVFVTPSHQAPTTVTMPINRRRELLQRAHDDNFVIVEDDYEFEMSFLAPATPALKSLDSEGRVIYVGSFSKSLFPGLRLGYMVASAEVIEEARAIRALILRHPPGHLQRTAAYYLAFGHYDALIRRMRNAFHERYSLAVEALAHSGLRVAGASNFGGTSLWIDGPKDLCSEKLASSLLPDGVIIEAGAPFFARNSGPCRHFRLGFSSISAARVQEGVRLIAKKTKDGSCILP